MKIFLDEFKKLINEKSNIDQQFLLLYQTFLNLSEYTKPEIIDILEKLGYEYSGFYKVVCNY